MAGYGEFSALYDALTENVPYDEIARYYDGLIRALGGKSGGVLLDLGCGTGNLTLRLAEKGYDVIGSDASCDMLSIAAAKTGGRVQLICQSMTETELYGTADIAVSTLDSINHLETAEDIAACFSALSKNMESGGLFLFDVNTIYKHREILAENSFVYDIDGAYVVWNNTFCPEDNGVDIDIDIFTENDDGSYTRGYEGFREIALSQEELTRLLDEAGFDTVAVYEYLTENPPKPNSDKLMFAARKR